MATRVFLGLGSNLDPEPATGLRDRLEMLQAATDAIAEGFTVRQSSRVYETEPVGGPEGQPAYLNAVLELDGEGHTAREMLTACLAIEDDLGRVRAERWGPRTIDIDLLSFGNERCDDPDLQLPHPRMHQRMFVLAPLMELDADPVLPGDRHVATMRLSVLDPFGVRPFAPPLRVKVAS